MLKLKEVLPGVLPHEMGMVLGKLHFYRGAALYEYHGISCILAIYKLAGSSQLRNKQLMQCPFDRG